VACAMTFQDAPTTRQQAPATHRFVPVSEAVRMLGLSATTIRRKIDAGELEAERVARPQGTAFLVKVPGDEPSRAGDALQTPQEAPGTRQDAPGRADSLAAVLVPLVAQIDALRQTVERQADQLVSQAETIGQLRAELAAERAKSPLDASTGAQSVELPPDTLSARLRPLSPRLPAASAVLAIVVVVVLLLVVPR
jgi:hypothetical protein